MDRITNPLLTFGTAIVLSMLLIGCATTQSSGDALNGAAESPSAETHDQSLSAKSEDSAEESAEVSEEAAGEVETGSRKLIMYLPNRLLDLTDIIRVRARVGPGFGLGARATTFVDAYLGSYVGIFAGLPGPRIERRLRSPVGFESYSGVEVSVAEATIDGGIGPGYSSTECGVNLHLLLIGVDVGVDPLEVVDFLAGLFTLEVRKDDF